MKYILSLAAIIYSLQATAQNSPALKELIYFLDADSTQIFESLHLHKYKQTYSLNFPGGGFVKEFEQKTNKTNEHLTIRSQEETHEVQLTSNNFEMLKKYRHQLQQQGFIPTGNWKGNSVKEEYQYTIQIEGLPFIIIYLTVEPGTRFTLLVKNGNYKLKETNL